jgi:UDP-2,3-diacylglucosamine pyrophosphatase LpxH
MEGNPLRVSAIELAPDGVSPDAHDLNRGSTDIEKRKLQTSGDETAYNEGSTVLSSREIIVEETPQSSTASSGHNILVVSDLHLGDSLRPTDPGYLKHVARLNRAFSRFLRHYATNTVDGKPWRLVIAGDMIDFLHAGLEGDAQVEDGHRETAHAHCSEDAAIKWLETVMVRERRVFRLLASFVGAGHQLVIIKGNHDAQFHFESVQKRFVELLLGFHVRRLLVRRKHAGAENAAELAKEMCGFTNRVSFCRWFYYERDLVYIEHGNQYDAFCSFEHVLSPIYPDHFEMEDPISHRTYREFAGLVKDLDVHTIDQWKLFDYARWVAGLGPRMIGRLAYTYFSSIAWLVRTKKRLMTAARKAREEHLRRRTLLTRRFGLSEDILHALDELRERPAGNSVFAGINMLYMDRVLLGAINLIVALSAAFCPGSPWIRGGIVGGVILLSLIANSILDRYREVSPHPKLMRMAKRIAGLVKVPFVIFGHSHIPWMEAARSPDSESWYFNTGSWTSTSTSGLTHVCILVEGKPKAELRRWCPESNKPLTVQAPA